MNEGFKAEMNVTMSATSDFKLITFFSGFHGCIHTYILNILYSFMLPYFFDQTPRLLFISLLFVRLLFEGSYYSRVVFIFFGKPGDINYGRYE